MFVHKRCKAFWQTIQTLTEDPRNPEDIFQKDVPDHVYDETKYAVLSRPMRPTHARPRDYGSFDYERRKLIEAKQFALRHGVSVTAAYGRR